MASPNTTSEVTRSLSVKTSEKFYVSFFGMPENLSNILGREVQTVSRPNITFSEYTLPQKGRKLTGHGYIEYSPIDVVFYDDSSSLISRALYEQVKRQTGKIKTDESIRFSMKCKIFATDDKEVENFEIMDCHITSVTHTEQTINDSAKNVITVTITFNDLCYNFPVLDA